jgi:Spy/CpxP family protein refolding chaperone
VFQPFEEILMTRFPLRVCVAALALAAGVGATSAFAQTAPADAPAAPPAHAWHHGPKHHDMHKMWRDAMMIPGLGPIGKHQVQELKLTAAQQAQLKEARDAQRTLFEARRDAMTRQHVLLDQQVSAGKLDPRALVSTQEAGRQQFQAQAGQVRDKWLAVWDGLNDVQRTQVAGFVKAREAKMQSMRERWQKHKDGMGHAGHAAQPAAPAAPSAPAGSSS